MNGSKGKGSGNYPAAWQKGKGYGRGFAAQAYTGSSDGDSLYDTDTWGSLADY